MKQLFLLLVLFVGLTAFATNDVNKISNETEVSQTEFNTGWDILINSSDNVIPPTPDCTATVTYNGEVVATFHGWGASACQDAGNLACNYIESQGGQCPEVIAGD